MKTNKELWNNYFKPTPPRMKQLGIAIRSFCTVISGSSLGGALSSDSPNKMFLWIALTSVLLQAIAEFIVNFFTIEGVEIVENKPLN